MSRLLSGSSGDEVPWQVLLILADGKKKNPPPQRNRQAEKTTHALTEPRLEGAQGVCHLPPHSLVQRTGWGNGASGRRNLVVAQMHNDARSSLPFFIIPPELQSYCCLLARDTCPDVDMSSKMCEALLLQTSMQINL